MRLPRGVPKSDIRSEFTFLRPSEAFLMMLDNFVSIVDKSLFDCSTRMSFAMHEITATDYIPIYN